MKLWQWSAVTFAQRQVLACNLFGLRTGQRTVKAQTSHEELGLRMAAADLS